MKVKIDRADYGNLIQDYPCLEKYREWFIPKNDDCDTYHEYENCIIKEMDNEELFNIIQELTSCEKLIVGYAHKLDHKEYGLDFVITIYDYYVELKRVKSSLFY